MEGKSVSVWQAGDAFYLVWKWDAQCFRQLATSATQRFICLLGAKACRPRASILLPPINKMAVENLLDVAYMEEDFGSLSLSCEGFGQA